MRVLVVNAGSSSLKLRVVDHGEAAAAWDLPAPSSDPRTAADALAGPLDEAGAFDAVGHRVVHGGPDLRRPTVVDDDVLARLRAVEPLAPQHNPPAVAAVVAARHLRPAVPSVVCFDTAFHATIPREAATYAVPSAWAEEHGVRRYGFHGLSYAWATHRAAALLGRPAADLRLVVCHLGAGASAAAVAGGRSVDTTMGFTPLEGLVMATRSGSVDPGALLWVQEREGAGPGAVREALERRSGLLGLSGVSGDLREVVRAADGGDDRAALALDVYVHRLRATVGAMAVSAGGLDALVFTGGVGEHSPLVRARACAGLRVLGVALDEAANAAATGGDAAIGAPGAGPAVLVVEAREDLEIAREAAAVLGEGGGDGLAGAGAGVGVGGGG